MKVSIENNVLILSFPESDCPGTIEFTDFIAYEGELYISFLEVAKFFEVDPTSPHLLVLCDLIEGRMYLSLDKFIRIGNGEFCE